MHIRAANENDIPALATLMGELGYPTSPEEMAIRLSRLATRTDIATFVAEENDIVAGMISVSVAPSLYRSDMAGAITALVVSSASRGRGVAPLLLEAGEKWLRHQGCQKASVQPSTTRSAAHRLYQRAGYEHTGLRFTKALI